MDFVSGVTWRSSQRGLVVCGPGGSPLLLDGASDAHELAALLGGSDADHQVVADLVAERIVADPTMPVREPHVEPEKRVVDRMVMPVLESWQGRIAIGVLVLAGAIALIVGRASLGRCHGRDDLGPFTGVAVVNPDRDFCSRVVASRRSQPWCRNRDDGRAPSHV